MSAGVLEASALEDHRLTAPTLWRTMLVEWDRALAWVLVGAALVGLLWGYRHLAGSPFGAEEVAYLISGGLSALVLLLSGVALLITADLRDEHSKLDRLEAAVWGEPSAAPPGDGGCPTDNCDGSRQRQARSWIGRIVAGVLVGLGFVVAGWARAAGTGHLDRALDGLALATFGPLLAGAAFGGHGLAARRSVVARRNAVLAVVHGAVAAPAVTADDRPDLRSQQLWSAPGLRRVHQRGCAALLSAGAPPIAVAERGRELCLLCHPEAAGRA